MKMSNDFILEQALAISSVRNIAVSAAVKEIKNAMSMLPEPKAKKK